MTRVLLIDDDPDIRMSMGAFLDGRYDVTVAENGAEALRVLDARRMDVIVLDLMMPILDGAALVRELAARGVATPVIVISAWSDARARIGAPVFRFVKKPFDLAELERTIDLAAGGDAARAGSASPGGANPAGGVPASGGGPVSILGPPRAPAGDPPSTAGLVAAASTARAGGGPVVTPRDADERFEDFVSNIEGYAIFLLDRAGRVATWNRGAECMTGWSGAEVAGWHFSLFYPPEDVAAGECERELAEAAAAGRIEVEGWRVRKDGSRFCANVEIAALRDDAGALCGYAKVARDVTAGRATEERLRESDERFRVLVRNVGDYAIFLLDPQGRVASWNLGPSGSRGIRSRRS